MTTDVHAHLLLPPLHAEVERRAPELVAQAADLERRRNGAESLQVSGPMIGARIPKLTDVNVRLAAMDAQGVDRQWVSVSPNHFYPWAPEGLAVWVAIETNRLIAEHVAQAPDRLIGLGVVPLQHPDRDRRVPRRRGARARARRRRDLVVRGRCRTVRRRVSSRSGLARRSSARSSSCTRSAAASTSGSTASTSPTPSVSRPRTPSRCRT